MRFVGSGATARSVIKKVRDAFRECNLVIITKVTPEGSNPVFHIYATTGKLEAGQIKEEANRE